MKKTVYVLLVVLVVFISIIYIKRHTRTSQISSNTTEDSELNDVKLGSEEKKEDPGFPKIEEQKKQILSQNLIKKNGTLKEEKEKSNESIKIELLDNNPYVEGIITDIMNLKTDNEEQKQMLADATLDFLVEIKKIKDSSIPEEVKTGKISEIFRASKGVSDRADKNIRKDYLAIVWGKNTDDIGGKRLDQAVETKYQDVLRVLYAAGGHKNVELDEETDKMVDYYVYELVRGQYDIPNFINSDEAEGHYKALMTMLGKIYDPNQLRAGMPGKYWFKIEK